MTIFGLLVLMLCKTFTLGYKGVVGESVYNVLQISTLPFDCNTE